jgi:hypothetical protein
VERRNGGPLVGLDLVVADDADDELVPERARLAQRVAVSVVHHVEAAVHVDPHGAAAAAAERAEKRRQGQVRDGGRPAREVEREHRGAQNDAADDARHQRPGAAAIPRVHGHGWRWEGGGLLLRGRGMSGSRATGKGLSPCEERGGEGGIGRRGRGGGEAEAEEDECSGDASGAKKEGNKRASESEKGEGGSPFRSRVRRSGPDCGVGPSCQCLCRL